MASSDSVSTWSVDDSLLITNNSSDEARGNAGGSCAVTQQLSGWPSTPRFTTATETSAWTTTVVLPCLCFSRSHHHINLSLRIIYSMVF